MGNDEKRPLGRILLQRKLVTQQELDSALREQKRNPSEHPTPLASRLMEAGILQELDALRALSEQHGVPGIDLGQVAILLEHLDVVPREVAEAHRILPVLVRGDRVFLAMVNPGDKRVIDELEFVTGKKIYPYIALSTSLERALAAAYDAKSQGEAHYLGPRVPLETLKQLGIAVPADRVEQPAAPPPPPAAAPPVPVQKAPPPQIQQAPQVQQSPQIQPRQAAMTGAPAASVPARKPPPPRDNRPPPEPASHSLGIISERRDPNDSVAEFSTKDFGKLDSEVSSVAHLPDELRVGTAQASSAMSGGTGKLVLVVDDEEDIRRLLKRLFLDRGMRVIEADRGLLALRLVKEHVPDLIVLDAMLPELHGFDIAKRIKGSEKYGHIPIIMISAVYRGWRIAEDLKTNYGIEEYIEKPFRIGDVLAAAQRALTPRQNQNSLPAEAPRDPETIGNDAELALNEGIAAYKAGRLDEAIEKLRRGTVLDPLAYRLHFHLALLYGKKGLVYEGIQELERAIDLNPRHFPALKNLAVLYEKAGFKNKAVEMWEKCMQGAPDAETKESIKQHLLSLL